MSGIELLFGSLLSSMTSAVSSAGIGTLVSAGATLAGAGVSAAASQAQGAAAAQAAEIEAASVKAAGTEKFAAAQREAELRRRQGQLQQSRGLAVAAASGGGTGGSARTLMAATAGETRLEEMSAYYEGQNARRNASIESAAVKAKGKAAAQAGKLEAVGTLLGGVSSSISKFG